MKPLYIFDLDGTLALCDHRRPILDNKDDPQRWDKFYQACDRDLPNMPVIRTMYALVQSGADVWVWSGREESVAEKTVVWLAHNTPLCSWMLGHPPVMRMRPAGDYTPDNKLKLSWLQEMLPDDRRRLVAIFDDRDSVVSMWRENGVPCFQVAPGDF